MKEKTGKQGIDKMTEFLKEADGAGGACRCGAS